MVDYESTLRRRSVLKSIGTIATGLAFTGSVVADEQSNKEFRVLFETSEAAWEQRMKVKGVSEDIDGIYSLDSEEPGSEVVRFSATDSFTLIPQHLNPNDNNPNNNQDGEWDNSLRRKRRVDEKTYFVESEDFNGKPGDRDWNDLVLRVEQQ